MGEMTGDCHNELLDALACLDNHMLDTEDTPWYRLDKN